MIKKDQKKKLFNDHPQFAFLCQKVLALVKAHTKYIAECHKQTSEMKKSKMAKIQEKIPFMLLNAQ